MQKLNSKIALATSAIALLTAAGWSASAEEATPEIVVTATRRIESVHNVPIAVSAFGTQALQNAGVTDVRDVSHLSPSFLFATGQSGMVGMNAYIRGVGTLGDNQGFESAVGFFIDGVYRNRPNLAVAELPEVERIEVLRGPQGTLFGRNTSAGAISIITAAPRFEPYSYGYATAGDNGAWEFAGGITAPLANNTLAFRIDGKIRERNGWIDDLSGGPDLNDRDRWFLRGQLLAEPSDNLSVRFIADYAERNEVCCSAINLVPGPLAAAVNGIAQLGGGIGIVTADRDDRVTTVSPGRDLKETVEEWGVSAEVNWNLSFGKLTSISSYRNWIGTRNQDVDFSDMDRVYRDGMRSEFDTFTQELRLQGEAGRLDWLVGAYYTNESLPHRDTIRYGAQAPLYVDLIAFSLAGGTQIFGSLPPAIFGPPQALIVLPPNPPGTPLFLPAPTEGEGQQADEFNVDTQSIAAFTHNEISVTDRLKLTLGLRFNHETKDIGLNLNATGATCDFLLANPLIAQGLAAASPSLFALACNPAITTEFNTAGGVFVVGGAPASGSREENEWTGTAALSYDFTDDILGYVSYSRGYKSGGYNLDRSGFSGFLYGGNGASIDDIEFEPEFVDAYELGVKTRWFDGRLDANATYFYEDFTDFQVNAFTGINFEVQNVSEVISQGVELDLIAHPIEGLDIQAGTLYNEAKYGDDAALTGSLAGLEGRQLPQAPKWVITSAITYTFPLLETTFKGLVHVDGRWNSQYNTGADLAPERANDAFGIYNARVGVLGADEQWSIEAWVSNLTDKYYSVIAFSPPEQPGTYAAYPNEPRMWGVTGRIKF